MPTAYGFLRFQIPGVALFTFWLVFLAPFVTAEAAEAILHEGANIVAFLGFIFLLSMLVGYIIHQFAVNHYRQEQHKRPVHDDFRAIIATIASNALNEATEKHWLRFRIVDSLLVSVTAITDQRTDVAEFRRKIDGRWSHLYARKALFPYAFWLAAGSALIAILFSKLPPEYPGQILAHFLRNAFTLSGLNWTSAGIVFVILLATLWGMNHYTEKLWLEICTIEKAQLEFIRQSVEEFLNGLDERVGLHEWLADLATIKEPHHLVWIPPWRKNWNWD